jgi:hypothetical protein
VQGRALESLSTNSFGDRVLKGPRLIQDRNTGEMVAIVERRADGVAGARGPSCLIFSTEAGFTRVWEYPANWQEMGADELIALTTRLYRPHSQSA